MVNKDHEFNFSGEDTYKINLNDNYAAEAVLCKNGQECEKTLIKGKWTSIYDQALNIELENGMRFIANLRYNLKPEISQDPWVTVRSKGLLSFGTIESGDYDKFNSDCN